MTGDGQRLRRLGQIAQLMRDRDLSRLSQASARRQQTEALLAALDRNQPFTGLDPVAAALVEDRFGAWTTNRRIVLNQQLARDMVEWIAARDAAQLSFGRAEVVKKLERRR